MQAESTCGGRSGRAPIRAPTIARGSGTCPVRRLPGRRATRVDPGLQRLTSRTLGDAPFCYGGAATCSVAPALEREMQARLNRLVSGNRSARPERNRLPGRRQRCACAGSEPAADRHVRAVRRRLCTQPRGLARPQLRGTAGGFPGQAAQGERPARAYAIVYAQRVVRVPDDADFPSWCGDLPMGGTTIPAGAPVLSVFAEAQTASIAQRLLQAREREAQLLLERWRADSPSECAA